MSDINKTIQQLNYLLQGIQLTYTQTLKDHQKIILIIDDINQLELMKDEQQYSSLLGKIIFTSQKCKQLELVCVSSSSYFTEDLTKNSSIRKFTQFEIIQDLDEARYPEFARKVIKIFEPNISTQLSNRIIEKQYSLRDIEILVGRLKQIIEQQTKINFIQSEYDIQKANKKYLIENIMSKVLNQSLRLQLTYSLKESKKQLKLYNCRQIIRKIRDNHTENALQVYGLNQITRELDQRNIINFCRPRSKLQKQAFQELYNKWTTGQKLNK